jgi:DNA invertase Pin-like site-specific DNA recombinase
MKIGYARVSTVEQNLDMQIDDLKKQGCEKIYQEKQSSGKDRPELEKALDSLREGDVFVFWKLDRVGRSMIELVTRFNDLSSRGVEVVSIKDQIDTSTPAGKLMFHLMASLSEFERDTIRSRTRAGLASARSRGRVGGRKKSLEGKQKSLALSMLKSGDTTIKDIAENFNVSESTIYRLQKAERNKVYQA